MKRDDLVTEPLGGNKVRALEFLLGEVRAGNEVITVGGTGSTHALATAVYAGMLGARTRVYRWPQVMNDSARAVDELLRARATVIDSSWVVPAYAKVVMRRLARARPGRPRTGSSIIWIPAGGTTPLGILGHVDAALELAEQVEAGVLPPPARVVLPLGSGGTAAGLLLGFAVAGLQAEVVAVQVVPRMLANAARVRRLAERTRRLIARVTGESIAGVRLGPLRVDRGQYGGAYGREVASARHAAARFRDAHGGAMLDATYSAKAYAAALEIGDAGPTVFWNTFDSRLLDTGHAA